MKATLGTINQMQAAGVISHYALSGAVGVTYYVEPTTISELNVLATLPFDPGGPDSSAASLHESLAAHGCRRLDEEHFEIGGWPVRFLPTMNDLEREAVASSLPVPVDAGRTWIVMAEHLMAIGLAANQLWDQLWMVRLIERDVLDELTLMTILKRFALTARWEQFEHKYPVRFPSEQETRNKLAALTFSEKIKILEKLSDREKAIAASGLRRTDCSTRRESAGSGGESG